MWNMQLLLTILLGILSMVAQSAPLRGSTRVSSHNAQRSKQQSHRRTMKDDDKEDEPWFAFPTTPPPTLPPTTLPFRISPAPTVAPDVDFPMDTMPPTVPDIFATTLPPSTTTPITTVQSPTSPPLAPGNTVLPLIPFSLMVEGELQDETQFREELQFHLLASMDIPPLVSIQLELSPVVDIGLNRNNNNRIRQRFLQQATLLEYEGVATLSTDAASATTTEDIQAAQITVLENTDDMQDFLSASQVQPMVLLKVEVEGRQPVDLRNQNNDSSQAFDQNSANNANQEPTEKSSTGGIVAGILIVLVLVGAGAGFFVHRQKHKPPPPPPYEMEVLSDVSEQESIEIKVRAKQTLENPTVTMDDSEAESPSTSPRVEIKPSDSKEEMEVLSVSGDVAVIDLTQPAKNSGGIIEEDEEAQAPPKALVKDDGSVANSAGDHEGSQAGDCDESHYVSIHSVVSNDTDSMAGYSLAVASVSTAPKKPPQKKLTPNKLWALEDPKEETARKNPPLKWFEQPRADMKRTDEFISSDSESHVTLDEVSNPLRSSETGEEETTMFLDDSQETQSVGDEGTEVSAEVYSSYKEDGGGDSSVMSGILSDADSAEGVFDAPVNNNGALGYFPREEGSDDDDELFMPNSNPPQQAAKPKAPVVYDSDAPSDERNSMEQDLQGFDAEATEKELETPMTGENIYADAAISPSGSWDDDPEAMEKLAKARRRQKRAARNKRAERKQPPVTMEV